MLWADRPPPARSAEAMGVALQKTSISTNIKERLDFSCALFSPSGDLIANVSSLAVVVSRATELGLTGPSSPCSPRVHELRRQVSD